MKSILERCNELHNQLIEHDARNVAAGDAEAYRARATELRTIREVLALALAKNDVLREKNVLPLIQFRDPSGVVSALQAVRKKLDDDPRTLNSGREFGQLKRSLDRLAKDAEQAIIKILESIAQDLPATDEAFLKRAEAIPGYSAQVADIRNKRQELLASADVKGLDAEGLAAFLDQRQALRDLTDNLRPTDFPPAVLEFFQAARRAGGAPFDKLTDEVRDWLREQRLLAHVRMILVDR